jgi:hypothetical protein
MDDRITRLRTHQRNIDRYEGLLQTKLSGASWSSIQAATGCARATIAKIAKRARVASCGLAARSDDRQGYEAEPLAAKGTALVV